MSKYLTPSILIIISIAVFFFFIKPTYSRVGESQVEEERFNELLSRTNELRDLRDDRLEEFNSLDANDVDRLTKFLPDNVDNIKLLIELDGIATRHGMVVRDVSFANQEEEGQLPQSGNQELGELLVQFVVSSPYGRFVDFLSDLENSLRLVDVRRISFEITEESDFTEYTVSLVTYWLPSGTQ
ncbi:MAG: hypothetical protein WDZ70_01735 [Candidatus Paceibacterota bacterium]